MAERGAKQERSAHVDADDDARLWREPQLAGAAKDHIPRLPAGLGERLVLDVGAALAFRTALTSGAWAVQRGAGAAVRWPAAEVPFGAGAHAFFSSSSSSAGPR